MLTQEQIEKAVQDSLPDVLLGLKQSLSEKALYEAREVVAKIVREEVTEWVKAEIVPAIKLALVESKDGLIATAPVLAAGITKALTTAMLADLKEKLGQSWNRGKIMEAMFK